MTATRRIPILHRTTFPARGVAARLERAVRAAGPAGGRYSKIDSGRKADTIQFGASTISLIRRSAATLATT